MGERAKILINEFTALELLKRDDLDLDKFYSSDLKVFITSAKKEIDRLNNIIDELYNECNECRHCYIFDRLNELKKK